MGEPLNAWMICFQDVFRTSSSQQHYEGLFRAISYTPDNSDLIIGLILECPKATLKISFNYADSLSDPQLISRLERFLPTVVCVWFKFCIERGQVQLCCLLLSHTTFHLPNYQILSCQQMLSNESRE